MEVKTRTVKSFADRYFNPIGELPPNPYMAKSNSWGRLVTASNLVASVDTPNEVVESIATSELHKNGFRSCSHISAGAPLNLIGNTTTDHNAVCYPTVTSKSVADAVGVGNNIPLTTRPCRIGWVDTRPLLEDTSSKWDALSNIRLAVEADLYNGLARPTVNDSRDLRATFELLDTDMTVRSLVDLNEFALSAIKAGRLSPSATVVQVAQLFLTYKFGIEPSVNDAARWCEKYLGQKPVKLVIHKPQEYGGTIRRAFRLDPLTTALPQEVTVPLSTYNVTWSYDNVALSERRVYGDLLASTVGLWPSTGLDIRPILRRRLSGVFFGRVAKPLLVREISENAKEELYSFDQSIVRDYNPIRDFVLAYKPLTTSWQLTKMSFLVDWVVNLTRTCERLESALSGMMKRVTFEEGVWLSIRDEQVVRYPCVTVVPTMAFRLIQVGTGSFTAQQSGSVTSKITWKDLPGAKLYTRNLADSILGSEGSILSSLKVDFKLSPFKLSAGAALLVTRRNTAKQLHLLMRR